MILDSVHREQRIAILSYAVARRGRAAHDIPRDVTVHALIRPRAQQLQLIVRAPLGVIRDIAFPEDARGYLEVEKLAPLLPDAGHCSDCRPDRRSTKGSHGFRDPRVAATQISLESDRSLASFDERCRTYYRAEACLTRRMSSGIRFISTCYSNTRFSPIGLTFSIRPGFERLAADVVTVLRFESPDGIVRAYEFRGDPGLVPLDPRWFHATRRFVADGIFPHPGRNRPSLVSALPCDSVSPVPPLVVVVTAFTVAHSITLIASAFRLRA